MQLAKHFATKFVELGAHTLVAERHFQGSIKSETGVEIISVRTVVYDLGAGRAPYVTFIAGGSPRPPSGDDRDHRPLLLQRRPVHLWCAAEASGCGSRPIFDHFQRGDHQLEISTSDANRGGYHT